MQTESRKYYRDEDLGIEASHFQGFLQPFPNHFHEHYTLGLIESGQRLLFCRGQEFCLNAGDVNLFHPGDNHACRQSDGGTLDYRGIDIPKPVMLRWIEEITGRRELPGFSQSVIHDPELACCLRALHEQIITGADIFEKEESLLLLLTLLLERYGQPFARICPECDDTVEEICAYLQVHFDQRICLDDICRHTGMSKSTLLRTFTKHKGITPYRYLETLRVNAAKQLLEDGVPPAEAALRTGFSDQSHFTNFFSAFIGVPPGAYRDIFGQPGTFHSKGTETNESF